MALWKNLTLGGKPNEANARLLIRQGQYFARQKNFELAAACFDQADTFGDGDILNVTSEARKALPSVPTRTLRNRWGWKTPTTCVHAAPMVLAVGTVIWIGYRYHSEIPWNVTATADVRSVAPDVPKLDAQRPNDSHADDHVEQAAADIRYVTRSQVPIRVQKGNSYVSGGMLPQFTTIEVLYPATVPNYIVGQLRDGRIVIVEAAALVPGDGLQAKSLWCNQHTQNPPKNNEILRQVATGLNQVIIRNNGDYDAVAKFRALNHKLIVSAYVAAFSTIDIENFPNGNFRLEFAAGHGWSRDCGTFVRDMKTSVYPDFDEFKTTVRTSSSFDESTGTTHVITTTTPSGMEYTITPVMNGNVRVLPLDLDTFLSDD